MAKLSKEEFMQRIDALPLEDSDKISLMEDVADSFAEADNSELEDVKKQLEDALKSVEDITAKYKARFLSADEVEEVKEEAKEEVIDPEMKEEEVIDVKDIFNEEKEDEE